MALIPKTSQKFAIIGIAGYIAPRHLNAMQALGCDLVAAHDVFDSVGIIDRYFPDAYFTTDVDDFRQHLGMDHVDWLSVCTPNFMHSTHAIMGLEAGANVICEKPLALTLDDLYRMDASQSATGGRICPILQLRLHPEIERLKQLVDDGEPDTTYDIDLTYITPRGNWYAKSWKGDPIKSGGLMANIGVHFIDMLHWIFGPAENITVHYSSPNCAAGFLQLKKARVRYFLSVNDQHRPSSDGLHMSPYRHMVINNEDFNFTNRFTDLHTLSYSRILEGKGFSVGDAKSSIETLETLRHTPATGLKGDYHPLLKNIG